MTASSGVLLLQVEVQGLLPGEALPTQAAAEGILLLVYRLQVPVQVARLRKRSLTTLTRTVEARSQVIWDMVGVKVALQMISPVEGLPASMAVVVLFRFFSFFLVIK